MGHFVERFVDNAFTDAGSCQALNQYRNRVVLQTFEIYPKSLANIGAHYGYDLGLKCERGLNNRSNREYCIGGNIEASQAIHMFSSA
jgi:hypothetical protein